MQHQQSLDPTEVESALELLDVCLQQRGKLIVSGVGKSGIVARKIAATFSSIGLTAIFLNPVDALHGDLGIVSSEDVALLLSNSGESKELLAILPHIKRRNTHVIALVGQANSRLAKCSDIILDSSVDREICPLNLAPTASTTVAMAIGDALAAVWMERMGISSVDFAQNHPAGSLGRRLTMTVSDLMVPVGDLRPLSPMALLPEVITNLTLGSPTKGCLGASWVHELSDSRFLSGLITDGDLRRTLQRLDIRLWDQITAADMATRNPITVSPLVLAVDALEVMEKDPLK